MQKHISRQTILCLLEKYCSSQLFRLRNEVKLDSGPYVRPFNTLDSLDWILTFEPVTNMEHKCEKTLFLHRVLFNIYEQMLIFLPKNNKENWRKDFDEFYGDLYKLGTALRPYIEELLFGCLNKQVYISGAWNSDAFIGYLAETRNEIDEKKTNPIIDAIKNSSNPKRAFKNYIVQTAGDLLSESSGVALNASGNYGKIQSELFTILIDEYGYGVHETKHSTLYENLLNEFELDNSIHAYWQYYNYYSLVLHNYIYYTSINHCNFFRQIGSLYYAETAYAKSTSLMSKMMSKLFGDKAYTLYYDEHAHIDKHHQVMALDRIIKPILSDYGDLFVEDMLLGIEEFKYIISLISKEYSEQIIFMDDMDNNMIRKKPKKINRSKLVISELKNENKVISNVYEDDVVYRIESGEMELIFGVDSSIILTEEQELIVPKEKLHIIKTNDKSLVNKFENKI